MDSRAKQRITGAVILVALFVLLVPALLTGPRGADAPDTPAEEGMRRYTIDLDAANPAAPTADLPTTQPAVALPAPAPVSDSQAQLAQPGEQAAPAVEPAPVVATPTPEASPAATRAPVVATPTPETSPAATRAPAQPAPVEPPAPAAQRGEAPKPTPPAPAQKGGFAVQLGSFSSRDNADRLVRDMTAKGFAAFIAPPIKTGGRELYRVRVGPTRDREQAEALAAQLRRIGQTGSIVPIS